MYVLVRTVSSVRSDPRSKKRTQNMSSRTSYYLYVNNRRAEKFYGIRNNSKYGTLCFSEAKNNCCMPLLAIMTSPLKMHQHLFGVQNQASSDGLEPDWGRNITVRTQIIFLAIFIIAWKFTSCMHGKPGSANKQCLVLKQWPAQKMHKSSINSWK